MPPTENHSAILQSSLFASGDDIHGYRTQLLVWGIQNFREFPWRLTTDPYSILVAEIMLHRTQVNQVVSVYENFIKEIPTIHDLAEANIDNLSRIMGSLGLQWRIDLMLRMAVEIALRHQGEIPQDRSALIALPGISEYIASAVRCFAWNHPEALIDTNTIRVTGRLFGLETRDSSRRNRDFRMILQELVDREQPRSYNYSLLDMAHKICTSKRPPTCHVCPILQWCHYGTIQKAG